MGLRVLALPRAADLPFRPCASRVLNTYDEGLWFEGIAAGADGTLYLSGNRGLDFSRGDFYYKAEGELIARKTDGSEFVLFKTPRGFTACVPLLGSDNAIYLTSHGERPCIWRIDSGGQAKQLARFPNGAWPNGLDEGPDGMLYTPDSERTIIGRAEQHIVGATDAVFRRTAGDRNTLYVVTDGGAFTGGPKTKGELVAMDPSN